MSSQRLTVSEHHSTTSPSEVVRVDIDADETYTIVVQHLGSQKCIVIDMVLPDGDRERYGHIYYGESGENGS